MLSRFPETRLARLLQCHSKESILELCDDYDDAEKEFYFDRNPSLFPYVLNFYNTGRLHVMAELCIFSFSQEIEYWGINEFFIDSCCSNVYHCKKMKPEEQEDWDDRSDGGNTTCSFDEVLEFYSDATKFDKQPLGNTVEHFGIGWFTFELVARFVVAPDLIHFFEYPLNLIDLVSILPFYLTLFVNLAVESSPALANLGRVVQVLRLMRIFRVLKLARHSTGLRSLGATLKCSYREVGLLLLYLAVGVSFFSVMAYTMEKEENDGLMTIPSCWWWATVSMTTVGYGDVVPWSIAGKLTASACILAGILVLVLPITLIFNKFSIFYKRQKQLEIAMRTCEFGEDLGEVSSINLRNYYAHKVKSLMASLSNINRMSESEQSLNDSIR
ncbi:hypothetical protein COCON_G00127800 [Conger conger]|uniref:Potassium voltage-gated channel modifier subfamily S member 2 n=1 Tax=Conger conger TaxID=82655 RepID=A0A9Q1HV57_CONCO|nr:hypothetical protein COCON_G00127800 [Conger conger]